MGPTKSFLSFMMIALFLSLAAEQVSWQQSLSFVVYCGEDFAVASQQSGLSGIDLKTGRIVWTALSDKITDEGPSAAGDSVAVITDSHNTIYAVSKTTGKLLWHRDHASNRLASDGRYFYMPEYERGKIAALDSASGSTVWTVDIPIRIKGYFEFLRPHDGFLFTDAFAIDLHTRKLVHQWPQNLMVTDIAFPRPGEILLGDTSGNLTLYDSAFQATGRWHVGDSEVETVATNEDGILVSLAPRDLRHPGVIEFLSWDGERKWTIPGSASRDIGLNPFTIAGHDALITEAEADEQWRFQSRSLTSGKVNWTAPRGNYYQGWPVVCGSTVFLRDGEHIREFNISDGTPLAPK